MKVSEETLKYRQESPQIKTVYEVMEERKAISER